MSPLYDRWVNPLFWTPPLRSRALSVAELDRRDLDTLDVGAGTGFATEGVVEHVDAGRVTMLDQSPAQLRRASSKPSLREARKLIGDAEQLPFADRSFDRYVSCGSIEYWPDPARALREAHRVLRPGGVAMVAGPLPPVKPLPRLVANIWMLFPTQADYRRWFEAAGFEDVRAITFGAPWNSASAHGTYATAVAGRATEAGPPPLPAGDDARFERADESWTPRRLARFVAGSLAGLLFVPAGIVMNLRHRRDSRSRQS